MNRRSLPIALVVGATSIGLTFAAFLIVGYWAGDNRFAWDPAAVAATGLATAGLAGATGWLAWSTSVDVRATRRIAEIAEADQELRDKPEIQVTFNGSNNDGLVLKLRNLGNGPARAIRIYVAGDLMTVGNPLEVVDFLAPDEPFSISVSHSKLTGRTFDQEVWDFAYMNRWRTWHYQSVGGQPIEAERVKWMVLGETPLGEGRLA